MKWNKKTIEQAEKELSEIGEKKYELASLFEFFSKYNIPFVGTGGTLHPVEKTDKMFDRAYTFLQTKMMLNACTTARSACKWAAIAAIVASIGIIASLYVFLLKMIFQILKGMLNIF